MSKGRTKKKSPETIERLMRNKIVIDEWIEKKIFEMHYSVFERIKRSLISGHVNHLSVHEKFIRDLAYVYKKNYGELPVIFRL